MRIAKEDMDTTCDGFVIVEPRRGRFSPRAKPVLIYTAGAGGLSPDRSGERQRNQRRQGKRT
jgi:hypothetical protein